MLIYPFLFTFVSLFWYPLDCNRSIVLLELLKKIKEKRQKKKRKKKMKKFKKGKRQQI